jgi:hypothetical protein
MIQETDHLCLVGSAYRQVGLTLGMVVDLLYDESTDLRAKSQPPAPWLLSWP